MSSIVVHDFRSGTLGGLCIESPDDIESEIDQARILDEKRVAKKEAQKLRKGNKKKS